MVLDSRQRMAKSIVRAELPEGVSRVLKSTGRTYVYFEAYHSDKAPARCVALQELAGYPIKGYGVPNGVETVRDGSGGMVTRWHCEARL